ncbi:hypothetical protein I0C86_25135 [Plantactinospora sp. S1510]|uniref:Uncharacterized protein n=1 Tax=Plantactinospora alkalitolerans TaxID=2789879 RepID=A0ABS0H1J9_9ACTN|nr:hypothetical protein [Plantactinospora alkalitolerans]MBF9132209.1 hypothetical protein [Plantactinospora alkalitolerans]
MAETAHLHALADAAMITARPIAKGIPVWRGSGLTSAGLLVDHFTAQVRRFTEADVVEHPFLLPTAGYRAVFGDYTNTYAAQVPGLSEPTVFRPDNLHLNVSRLAAAGTRRAVVAVGGLVRTLTGGATPVFRDCHIWPAVQANQLVEPDELPDAMDRWRRATEAVIRNAGLPVLSIAPPVSAPYGKRTLLVLSCLPDGRLTVLATIYALAEHYRSTLGTTSEVVDVGFTGKILAVAAMHHRDHRGLALPSTLAPRQVGVIVPRGSDRMTTATSGLRAEVVVVGGHSGRRRAERRLHRRSVPVVVSYADDGSPLLVGRLPLRRDRAGEVREDVLIDRLRDHDDRLRSRSDARWQRGLARSSASARLCPPCAVTHRPTVHGWVVPADLGPCGDCGRAGRLALLSDVARIY